jgi:hypothetical protein
LAHSPWLPRTAWPDRGDGDGGGGGDDDNDNDNDGEDDTAR